MKNGTFVPEGNKNPKPVAPRPADGGWDVANSDHLISQKSNTEPEAPSDTPEPDSGIGIVLDKDVGGFA